MMDDWSTVARFVDRNVLLTLSELQQEALSEWGLRLGRKLVVRQPFRNKIDVVVDRARATANIGT